MSEYPEHDKLKAVIEESQAIGEFLDFGLPKQNLALYEFVIHDCECSWCERGQGHRSPMHTAEQRDTMFDKNERRIHDAVQISTWQPTHRSIQKILAEYFGIDQKKIDNEKAQMLAALRAS
jgi:hypothetical protein